MFCKSEADSIDSYSYSQDYLYGNWRVRAQLVTDVLGVGSNPQPFKRDFHSLSPRPRPNLTASRDGLILTILVCLFLTGFTSATFLLYIRWCR